MSEVIVEIKGLKKHYDDLEVLKGIDLVVHKGEKVVVLGPSGSGKSTMLRCINALEDADGGTSGGKKSLTIKPTSIKCASTWGWFSNDLISGLIKACLKMSCWVKSW